VKLAGYPLLYDHGWQIDFGLESITRARGRSGGHAE
jgi:hypothetical protein